MSTLIGFTRFVFLLGLVFTSSQATTNPTISNPGEGEVVEGIVEIRGNVPANNFASAKLSYAYSGDNVEDWFLIANIDAPKQDEVLAAWDTTTITDGTYQIRLRVRTATGEKNDVILSGIQVANYSRSDRVADDPVTITTNEPLPQVPIQSIEPTPAFLPPNPAMITSEDLRATVFTGFLIGVGLVVFVLVWSYLNHK